MFPVSSKEWHSGVDTVRSRAITAQPPWGIETRPPCEHRALPPPLEMPILGEKQEKTKLIEMKCDNLLFKWKGFLLYSLKMQLYALFKAQNYLAAVLAVQREVMLILGLLDHKEGVPLNVSDRYPCVRPHLWRRVPMVHGQGIFKDFPSCFRNLTVLLKTRTHG